MNKTVANLKRKKNNITIKLQTLTQNINWIYSLRSTRKWYCQAQRISWHKLQATFKINDSGQAVYELVSLLGRSLQKKTWLLENAHAHISRRHLTIHGPVHSPVVHEPGLGSGKLAHFPPRFWRMHGSTRSLRSCHMMKLNIYVCIKKSWYYGCPQRERDSDICK